MKFMSIIVKIRWLSGFNKKVQEQYWELVKERGWDRCIIPSSIKGIDSIVENTLVGNPDTLTGLIESGAMNFIGNVEAFLSEI